MYTHIYISIQIYISRTHQTLEITKTNTANNCSSNWKEKNRTYESNTHPPPPTQPDDPCEECRRDTLAKGPGEDLWRRNNGPHRPASRPPTGKFDIGEGGFGTNIIPRCTTWAQMGMQELKFG